MGTFDIVPAITVAYGRVVGTAVPHEPRMASNPLAVARYWLACGARRLHVEELGVGRGLSTMPALLLGCSQQAHLQVGGGVRDERTAGLLRAYGASTLVVRQALAQPHSLDRIVAVAGAEHLMMGIDLEDLQDAPGIPIPWLSRGQSLGITRVLLSGPWYARTVLPYQLDAIRLLLHQGFRVWAAGGIRHLETVAQLRMLGVDGAIVGRALAGGVLDLEDLHDMAIG